MLASPKGGRCPFHLGREEPIRTARQRPFAKGAYAGAPADRAIVLRLGGSW